MQNEEAGFKPSTYKCRVCLSGSHLSGARPGKGSLLWGHQHRHLYLMTYGHHVAAHSSYLVPKYQVGDKGKKVKGTVLL